MVFLWPVGVNFCRVCPSGPNFDARQKNFPDPDPQLSWVVKKCLFVSCSLREYIYQGGKKYITRRHTLILGTRKRALVFMWIFLDAISYVQVLVM